MRAAGTAVAALALASVLAGTFPARAADAGTALAAARRRVESADYRLIGRMVRVDANGARTSENVNILARWFPGTLRILLKIDSPAAARAHVLLEMRPDGKSTILIAHPGDAAPAELPFSAWTQGPMGAAFSYEDFMEAQYFWPGQKYLGEAKYGARTCGRLLSTPGAADRTHYASVESWLDPGSGFPVYSEKKLKGAPDVKQFTYFGLRQTRGVWWASQVEARIRGRAGSTLLIVERGSPEAHLGLKDFDPARLTKF